MTQDNDTLAAAVTAAAQVAGGAVPASLTT